MNGEKKTQRVYRIGMTGALLLTTAIGLSACMTRKAPPAPVAHIGAQIDAPTGATIVQRHESLFDISERYNLALRDIIDINNISPPYTVTHGQRIRLPAPREYQVAEGDTLYRLSRMLGVTTTELARQNNLSPPYHLTPGQTLRVASSSSAAGLPPMATMAPVADAGFETAAPLPVASVERVELSPLPNAPRGRGLPAPGDHAASSAQNHATAPRPMPAVSPLDPPQATPVAVTQAAPAPTTRVATPAAATAAPPRAQSHGFAWPVQGQVLSSFGPKDSGLHNDGINIAAPKGTEVRAASQGEVMYVGDALKGFGNLVLIRHANGWVTAYGHLDGITVTRGQKVNQGETIGKVGDTGRVDRPQLHFEIRRGSEALNPERYLQKT